MPASRMNYETEKENRLRWLFVAILPYVNRSVQYDTELNGSLLIAGRRSELLVAREGNGLARRSVENTARRYPSENWKSREL
jgi:hypothetical protein